nr:MAG TPA: hypothetical protein [Caudoviricetes sp.]
MSKLNISLSGESYKKPPAVSKQYHSHTNKNAHNRSNRGQKLSPLRLCAFFFYVSGATKVVTFKQ